MQPKRIMNSRFPRANLENTVVSSLTKWLADSKSKPKEVKSGHNCVKASKYQPKAKSEIESGLNEVINDLIYDIGVEADCSPPIDYEPFWLKLIGS